MTIARKGEKVILIRHLEHSIRPIKLGTVGTVLVVRENYLLIK